MSMDRSDPRISRPQQRTPDEGRVTYNEIHTLLGQRRSDLWTVIAAYQRGDSVESFSMKERVGALEGMILDDLWTTRISPRFTNPAQNGVHGLAAIEGLDNLLELTEADDVTAERVALPGSIAAYPILEREWQAVVSYFQEQATREQQFDLLYQISMAQAKTMLYEMHRWETERIHALENGDDSPQTATYREFIALLAEFKPHVSPAGIDYPAYRKLIKGLLFGTPFQWRVIRQFPAFAASVGMEWNNQTFDALMRALEMAVKKVARIHASVLVLQAHVLSGGGYDLSDMMICRRHGDSLQLVLDPIMMNSLKQAFSMPEVAQAAREIDSGPITSCTAIYSDMFDGTIQWNGRIAKELMVPQESV